MTFETINEPVEVISYYDKQHVRPLRFRWRERAYHVSHINAIWSDVKGRDRIFHYHVATRESGSFELVYNASGLQWKLGRVCLDD